MKLKRYLLIFLSLATILILASCNTIEVLKDSYLLNEQVLEINQTGIDLLEEGKIQEAVIAFNKALDHTVENKLSQRDKDSPLNNLSWAYHELGENEKSLEYIEKALKIPPNTDTEYINKGNALYGLSRYEEALINYDKAIEINKHSLHAYYGRGSVYFDTEEFEKAIVEFDRYLTYDEFDEDALIFKVYSFLNLDEGQKALQFTEELIYKIEDRYFPYEAKSIVLDWIGSYEEAKIFYEETATKFPNLLDAQRKVAELEYNYGNYNQSIIHFTKLIEEYPDHTDLYVWIIYSFGKVGELNKAIEYYNKALTIDDTSHELYNAIGNVYIDETLYMEAIDYFDKSITYNPTYEDAYVSKLDALYNAKRYSRCIDFGKESEGIFPSVSNIQWYIGECYYELGEFQESILYYKKTIGLDPMNDIVLSDIAYSYLSLEDFIHAKEYSDKSLEINSENETALYIKKAIQEHEEPLGTRIKEFFYDNYLYFDQLPMIENAVSESLDKQDITYHEIDLAINSMKHPDDIFTFVVYGEDYDYLISLNDSDIHYKEYGDILYVKIENFSSKTDNRVIEKLDKIQDTEEKILAIDLRNNSGGHTNSANNILDALIPKQVTSTLIDRDGYTNSYYSDASQIRFQRIYILVNEETASAAELFALSMKTFLNNVTILGNKTYGKGTGQSVFEDKKAKVMVFVTNHYWNVRQKNIMHSAIIPDITVESADLEDFINIIYED
jgi:tetratricopeptide (TPR) repeat protein